VKVPACGSFEKLNTAKTLSRSFRRTKLKTRAGALLGTGIIRALTTDSTIAKLLELRSLPGIFVVIAYKQHAHNVGGIRLFIPGVVHIQVVDIRLALGDIAHGIVPAPGVGHISRFFGASRLPYGIDYLANCINHDLRLIKWDHVSTLFGKAVRAARREAN
jgi:hypothetical protein